MDEPIFSATLDCSGMNCPLPVVKTKQELERLAAGEVVKVIATDPGSQNDIPSFCRRNSFELLSFIEEGNRFFFYIKK